MTWHAGSDLLDRYMAGSASAVHAMSVETHLLECAECRAAVATRAEGARLEQTWLSLIERIDRPPRSWLERGLSAVGVGEGTARLLTATPALRLPFVAAVGLVLSFAVLSGGSGRDLTAVATLLLLAPVLPVAGIALAYGPAFDPAHEITVTTPMPGFRLLMMRSFAVLTVTTVLGAAAAVAAPGADWRAAAWMLPALALTALTLALATWVPVHTAAGLLGGIWVVGTLTAVRILSGQTRPSAQALVDVAVFRPSGQVACAVVAVAALAVAVRRRTLAEMEVSP